MDFVKIYGRTYHFLGESDPKRIIFNKRFIKRLAIMPKNSPFARLQTDFPHIKGFIILTSDGEGDDTAVYQLHGRTRIAMGYLNASDGHIFDTGIKSIRK